ncbi:14053_t:CDS:1, partial [Dentiscutata erythropus]
DIRTCLSCSSSRFLPNRSLANRSRAVIHGDRNLHRRYAPDI